MRSILSGVRPLSLLGLVLAMGCFGGTDRRLVTYPVGGRLFVHNKPAANAIVQLYGTNDPGLQGLCPHGVVAADGTFHLTTYKTGDGAPLGDYALTVRWPTPAAPGRDEDGPDRFQGRYADPRRPLQQVVILPGPNDLGRIDIP